MADKWQNIYLYSENSFLLRLSTDYIIQTVYTKKSVYTICRTFWELFFGEKNDRATFFFRAVHTYPTTFIGDRKIQSCVHVSKWVVHGPVCEARLLFKKKTSLIVRYTVKLLLNQICCSGVRSRRAELTS